MMNIDNHDAQSTSAATIETGFAWRGSIFTTECPPSLPASTASWRYQVGKRTFDLLSSLLVSAVFAIPALLIAAAIVLTSDGPVFYRENRIGQRGHMFRIWKFRTMHLNAGQQSQIVSLEPGGSVLHRRMQKHLRDPRITKIGAFLRRWSLDELPQLLNVILGEMSLIGPRPIVEEEIFLYGERLNFYLNAKPGLSGLWQVSGRSSVGYSKRAELDAAYIRSWTFQNDLKILIRTIPAVLRGTGCR